MHGLRETRCHRLKKTCEPSAFDKRRGPKRQTASRSARLEEKLDGLVSLLRDKNVLVPLDPDGTGGGDSETDGTELEVGTASSSTAISPNTVFGETNANEPSPMEAEDCLRKFREEMMVSPIVVSCFDALRGMWYRC